MRYLKALFLAALLSLTGMTVSAAEPQAAQKAPREYFLGAGDIIRISVFQNPDLTTDARVSERGEITLPLIGVINVGGMTTQSSEQKIAQLLKDGGFIVKPQVTVLLTQTRSSQVAVLGQFNRPGRYALETADMRLSDMLATAGGISTAGSDIVVLTGRRDGKYFRREIDINSLFAQGDGSNDVPLIGGDAIFVDRAPMFYVYGEVQRPGSFRVERSMTVMQALAVGGGMTQRGTLRGLQINRRDASGKIVAIQPKMDDLLQPDDVIYVRESLF